MKRRLAALAISALVLTGCGTGTNDDKAGAESDMLYERTKVLEDGRAVTCIVFANGYKGGLSCDWDNAK